MRDVIGEAIKQDAKQLAFVMVAVYLLGWICGAMALWLVMR